MPAVLAFRGSRRWESLVLGLLFGAQVLAYALYFHPGTYMGPRYWYEVAWAPLMVAAEGVVVLSGWLERRLNRRVVGVILVGAVLTFAGMSLRADWHLLPGYRGYNRMYRSHIPAVNTPALVFVPARELAGLRALLRPPVTIPDRRRSCSPAICQAQCLEDRPPVPNEALTAYFADRHVYG